MPTNVKLFYLFEEIANNVKLNPGGPRGSVLANLSLCLLAKSIFRFFEFVGTKMLCKQKPPVLRKLKPPESEAAGPQELLLVFFVLASKGFQRKPCCNFLQAAPICLLLQEQIYRKGGLNLIC